MSKLVQLPKPYPWIVPVPAVILTCGIEETGYNAITLSWAGVVASEPPQVAAGVRRERHTFKLLEKVEHYVLNMVTEDQLDMLRVCGKQSGKNVDKFAAAKMTPALSPIVPSVAIAESKLQLHCAIRQRIDCGSHVLFIGEVLATLVDSELVAGEGRLDAEAMKPACYIQGTMAYWGVKKIGAY